MSQEQLRRLAMRWVFPVILFSLISGQERPYKLLLVIGAVSSVATVLVAAAIVLLTFPRARWSLLLVAGTVFLRAARVLMGEAPGLVLAYSFAAGLLFAAAGMVMAIQRPRQVHRQALFFCLISLPLMLLQLLGVGDWTQLLRTDIYGSWPEAETQYPTLFVPEDQLVVTTLQARPAGFLFANVALSPVLVFAVGLHMARPGSERFGWREVVLCATIVLAMAKVVFLAFASMAVWLLIAGGHGKRRRVIRMGVLSGLLILLYISLFPGVAATTLSWDNMQLNFLVRYADFLFSTNVPVLADLASSVPRRALVLVDPEEGLQSGYATIAAQLPFVMAGALVLAPFFFVGLRRLRKRAPEFTDSTVIMLLAAALIPLITSFLGSAIYSFIFGFGLIPLVLLKRDHHRLFQGTDHLKERRMVATVRAPRPPQPDVAPPLPAHGPSR